MSSETGRTRRLLAAVGAIAVATLAGGLLQAADLPGLAGDAGRLEAQERRVPVGSIVPRMSSLADSTQSYALYLPAGFDRSRSWPALFLFDPRGRAVEAIEPFREAADELGWVLLASHGAGSGEGPDRNERAFDAMLLDAQSSFSLDPERIYLAGLGEMAHTAWLFALRLDGYVTGVVAVDAGLPPELEPEVLIGRIDPVPDFFAAVPSEGLRWGESIDLDRRLAEVRLPRRLVTFPGARGWPPEAVAGEGLRWLELRSMRRGMAEIDTAWLAAEWSRRWREAESSGAAGRLLEAHRSFDDLAADFPGPPRGERARERRAELAADSRYESLRELSDRLEERHWRYRRRVFRVLTEFAEAEPPGPTAEEVAARLDLAVLERAAAEPGPDGSREDALRAAAARRLLAVVRDRAVFRWAGELLESDRPEKALVLARVGERAWPDADGRASLVRARALASLGESEQALEALGSALAAGVRPAEVLADPHLAPLRGDPRWRELMARYREADALPSAPGRRPVGSEGSPDRAGDAGGGRDR